MARCVNLDWLEVYCMEDFHEFPCNADYYRRHGYIVHEREYGTRQYKEMFTLEDREGHKWIEIRRNPANAESSFSGFTSQSTHIRLTNRACYDDQAIGKLRAFLLHHHYEFRYIFRIDVCYDFERFDSGDYPAKFARRYLSGVYAKINQCRIAAYGQDNWSQFDWETISWGSPTSMVSTKMYNKSRELSSPKHDKPYIKYSWFVNGLIDDPVNLTKAKKDGKLYKPEIWRVEFSMKSNAKRWLTIEDSDKKGRNKRFIPHSLELFDTRDKQWQRFEELAYHYFRFKILEKDKRKDRCKDKRLFDFNSDRDFLKLDTLPGESKPEREDEVLKRKLAMYRMMHADADVRKACDILIQYIDSVSARRFTPHQLRIEAEALQAVMKLKMGGDERTIGELFEYVKSLLESKEIF